MRLRSTDQNRPRTPNAKPRPRSPITKYYRSSSSGLASPFTKKTPKKSARRFLFGILDIILIGLALFGIFYSLGIKPQPKIIVNDGSFHSSKEYANTTNNLFHSVKNRNKITFDEQSIAANLQKQYPEITNVQIELPFFSQRPVVRLAVAKPSFILKSQNANYIVNTDGVAVSKLSGIAGNKLVSIDDQSGFVIKPGDRVLSSASVAFIDNLIRQCRKAGIEIKTITIPQAPQELILRTKDQPYYVKFYMGGDVGTQAGQFLAARQNFKNSGKAPLIYLDVRINGKIFYK
jgi:hypothetical protein